MADTYKELKDWSNGVIAANETDIIPDNSSPKAWNSAFQKIGQGNATLGVRSGLVVVNETALSGTPAIIRMKLYAWDDSGDFTNFLAIIGDDGKLYYKDESDTIGSELTPPANYPFTSGHCFAAGDYPIDAAVMANRLFLVNTNGERRSLLGDEYVPFGLSPVASVAISNQGSGSSSMPAETYDVSVTSYNSNTGAESSVSLPVEVTLTANQRIRVIISPTSAETAQYTHWRIYIRRQTTQAVLYQVQVVEDSGGSNITTTANIPIATTTGYVDLTSAQIADLIIASPTITENNPPSTDIRFLAVYGRRLIAASQRSVFYSALDKPDAFPPNNEEPIETGEGDEITGIHVFSDELLVVFTQANVFGIFGNDPQTWTVRPIDRTVGCSSHTSVVEFDGKLGWWSPQMGMVVFDGQSVIREGLEKLGHDIMIDNIEASLVNRVCVGISEDTHSVLWYVPEDGETRLTMGLPYNYLMKQWESSKWTPMHFASLENGYDSDGNARLFAGNYEGQVFKFDHHVQNDGVPSGTTEGTFTASASTQGTITSTGFYTTGAGLAERFVTIVDAENKPVARKRIVSNTSTVLTLDSNITGLIVGDVYTWYVGGPDFRLYTKWFDMDQPFLQKRFDRVYMQAHSEDAAAGVFVSTHVNFVDEDGSAENTIELGGDVWDEGVWDSSIWAGTTQFKKRLGVFKNTTALRIAVLHFAPNVDLRITKIGVLARLLSDRFYS